MGHNAPYKEKPPNRQKLQPIVRQVFKMVGREGVEPSTLGLRVTAIKVDKPAEDKGLRTTQNPTCTNPCTSFQDGDLSTPPESPPTIPDPADVSALKSALEALSPEARAALLISLTKNKGEDHV